MQLWLSTRAKWFGGCMVATLSATLSALGQAPVETKRGEASTRQNEIQKRLKAFELENTTLHQQNEMMMQSLGSLAESLAEANAEAEVFRRQYLNLKTRMESLGVDAISDRHDPMEQRLLKSVRDLELLKGERDGLSEQLVRLAESVFCYLKSVTSMGDPKMRQDVEASLRSVNASFGNQVHQSAPVAEEVSTNLPEGLVVSYKAEMSLIVANFGSKLGVKLGLPLTIIRGNSFVGRARVVHVRERLAGAILEEIAKDAVSVRIGDQLRVGAHN